jgi:hypothetical protein
MDIKRAASQPSAKGSSDWFTGSVRVDPLFQTPDPAHSFHSSHSGGQFWTEQSGVGSLEGNPADRRESQIDGRGRVLLLLEIDSVPQHDGAVECETGFRAVPIDEVGDGPIVSTLAALGGEAILWTVRGREVPGSVSVLRSFNVATASFTAVHENAPKSPPRR